MNHLKLSLGFLFNPPLHTLLWWLCHRSNGKWNKIFQKFCKALQDILLFSVLVNLHRNCNLSCLKLNQLTWSQSLSIIEKQEKQTIYLLPKKHMSKQVWPLNISKVSIPTQILFLVRILYICFHQSFCRKITMCFHL